jgi:hypothetical protein
MTMTDLSNKPISYTGSHPLELAYRALLARAEAAEAEAEDAILAASDAAQREENAMHALSHFRARVAELEAQLVAQGWRPGSETPKHDWYLVYDFSEDDQPLFRYYGPAGWRLSGDRHIPNWYMPIPPLPPAPQETTE